MDVISEFFRALTEGDGQTAAAWKAFHRHFSERCDDFSALLDRCIPEEDLIHLLGLLLVPVVRSGFKTGERCERLFAVAESMGVHLVPVHYYSPLPDTRTLSARPWTQRFDRMPGWNLNESVQVQLISELGRWAPELEDLPYDGVPEEQFFWKNPCICPTDAAVYYSMIRKFRPRRVIEVGGGYSTRIAARACLRNGDTELCCIEPYPGPALQKEIPGLARLIAMPVQDVPLEHFDALTANDILFVDGTHCSKIDSDVNHIFFKVLTRLRDGVLVHFHDIFLPGDYPQSWVKEKHLFWNEQYLLLAFLMFNEVFTVLLGNYFLGREHPEKILQAFPFLTVPGGASFWIRRTGRNNVKSR